MADKEDEEHFSSVGLEEESAVMTDQTSLPPTDEALSEVMVTAPIHRSISQSIPVILPRTLPLSLTDMIPHSRIPVSTLEKNVGAIPIVLPVSMIDTVPELIRTDLPLLEDVPLPVQVLPPIADISFPVQAVLPPIEEMQKPFPVPDILPSVEEIPFPVQVILPPKEEMQIPYTILDILPPVEELPFPVQAVLPPIEEMQIPFTVPDILPPVEEITYPVKATIPLIDRLPISSEQSPIEELTLSEDKSVPIVSQLGLIGARTPFPTELYPMTEPPRSIPINETVLSPFPLTEVMPPPYAIPTSHVDEVPTPLQVSLQLSEIISPLDLSQIEPVIPPALPVSVSLTEPPLYQLPVSLESKNVSHIPDRLVNGSLPNEDISLSKSPTIISADVINTNEGSSQLDSVKKSPENGNISNKTIPPKKKMELRSNASTDDLLSLESGIHQQRMGGAGHLSTPFPSTNNSLQSSLNTTPLDTPKSTPSTTRKVKPALKLNLDDTTWSTTPKAKPTTSDRIRQNFETGKAKMSAVVQHSRTPEFRFRMVLVLLFGCIVSMVTFTWYLYQRQMLQLTIGDKIRFLETQRILHLLKTDGKEMLRGILGIDIPPELAPYDCQFLRGVSGSNICMEWKYRARLQITYNHEPNVSCYSVHWESLSRETLLKDCFDLHSAHWYGMGELRNASWPLSGASIPLQPMVTGDLRYSDFGSILERYWLSSSGVGILVDPDVPLFISLNATGEENLCLESHYDTFPYKTPEKSILPTLEYTICTSSNTKSVHEAMIKQFAVLPTNISTADFLQSPLWATAPKLKNALTQEALQNYSHDIIAHGFDEPGYIVLDESWQNQLGDLEFKTTNIPVPEDILVILQNKGFKVLLTVHPYVCLDSKTFHNGTVGNYLVSDRHWQVPLLTRWPDSSSVCGIIDLTKNASSNWFLSRLKALKAKYEIEGFYFTGGQSYYLPQAYQFNQSFINPDGFLYHYANVASQLAPIAGLSFGFETQSKLSYVRLSPRTSTWDSSRGLQSVIPTVLNLAMLGYPLVNPGSVGGDELPGNITLPDNELYLRWLQMAVFLPVLQLSIPPVDYGLREIKVAKVLLKARKERVFPVMQRCLQEFLATGAPIIRPLWWLAPNDPITYGLETQFAIGDEIIVAPVTEPGMRNREVYLPDGFWKDEITGKSLGGGRWYHNYTVPLEKLAYFIRTEDSKQ